MNQFHKYVNHFRGKHGHLTDQVTSRYSLHIINFLSNQSSMPFDVKQSEIPFKSCHFHYLKFDCLSLQFLIIVVNTSCFHSSSSCTLKRDNDLKFILTLYFMLIFKWFSTKMESCPIHEVNLNNRSVLLTIK